jgi:DNA-binding transcriptional MocR family regulator
MFIRIDKTAGTPVYRQIIDAVRRLIDEGAVPPGTALPATRRLAVSLGVNRTTVVQAYEELQALGYLASRPGSYHHVRSRIKEAEFDPGRKSAISWGTASTPEASRIHRRFQDFNAAAPSPAAKRRRLIDFSGLTLDPRLYPIGDLRKCVDRVLREGGGASLVYGDKRGLLPLREELARRMRRHGVAVSANEILVTSGAQQAIDLVTRMLVRPGSTVVVESPTYGTALPLFEFNGARIAEIPMRPDGLDLDALEGLLRRRRPAFIYTMPNFQNPTGITTGHAHRERLLGLCLRFEVPLVEDGFEEDMKYFGRVDLPVKSMDEHNLIIYLGTFSKALFPGIRLGWITADRDCIERLVAIKGFSELTTSLLVQAVMERFCREGLYDRHLRRLHRVFRKRLTAALRAMDEHFPPAVTWTRPQGGYTLWVRLPKRVPEPEWSAQLESRGVRVSPGRLFFSKAGRSRGFRLSISGCDEEEAREGLARLGRALKDMFPTVQTKAAAARSKDAS